MANTDKEIDTLYVDNAAREVVDRKGRADLATEIDRAKAAEKSIIDELKDEIASSVEAEAAIRQNVDGQLLLLMNSKVGNDMFDAYKSQLNGDLGELDSKKADKSNTYTKTEVDAKVAQATPTDYNDVKTQVNTNKTKISEHDTSISSLQEEDVKIKEKIQDIELAKFPNVTIFGQPTINQGQISNFSVANYCQFPFIVNFQGRPFTLDFEITTGAEVTQQHNVFDSLFGLAFAVRQSKFVVAISTNGTSWNIGEGVGTHTIQPNSTYRIRMSWNLTTFTVAYSTDGGSTYTTDITKALTQQPYPKQMFIGVTSDKSTFFNGIINLNYAALTISDKVVWQGMDDVGLSTRANVSLTNLDEEGIAKIQEIAQVETLHSVQNEVYNHDGRIHELEREMGKIEIESADWEDIMTNVDLGYAPDYYPVATQIITDYDYNGTKYSCPQNIVDHKPVVNENDEEVNGMTVEWEYTIPLGIPFDPDEALYVVPDGGMAPATYHFTVQGDSWASQNGKVYQFTVTSPLTAGMHLKPTTAYNKAMTEGSMRVYADGKSFTALYNFPITEGSGGTNLGTMGSGDLNHYHRVFLGYNRWSQSFVRQWLNNKGLGVDWWQPQNKFDRAPSNYATLKGFLDGYSEDFLNVLKPIKLKTYRNTVTDDGGIDETIDKVFIGTFANWNCNTNQTIQYKGGEEGQSWEYYEKFAEGIDNLATNGSFKWGTTYPELIRYALNAKTSAQYVFSRSPYRSGGSSVCYVYASGSVSNYGANYSHRFRPACVIRGNRDEPRIVEIG